MRISESRIRRIIREEAKRALQEMPYAGSLGGGEHPDPERRSGITGARNNPKAALRFAGSARFRSLAEKHLENIRHPVWFAPLGGAGESLLFDSSSSRPRPGWMGMTPSSSMGQARRARARLGHRG